VAKNLGQFGVEVYHVQEETRGLFITKNKLLEDIRVREQTCEAQLEILKEVQQLAKDLTEKLKIAKREGSQFFLEVQSLEVAIQRVNNRGKDEAKARKVAEIKGVTVAQTLQIEREEMTKLRNELQETEQARDQLATNVGKLQTNIQVLEKQASKFKTAKEHTLTKVCY
jgi:chromosome segregation ATPase